MEALTLAPLRRPTALDQKFAVRRTQQALWCRLCAQQGKLIGGYCSCCYARRRWDARYFAGLRAQVLARDSHTCQLCTRSAAGKRSIAVHHRRPGVSKIASLISLCPGCHARLHKTLVWRQSFFRSVPLAVQLWRELHPGAPEQLALGLDGSAATSALSALPPRTYEAELLLV